MPPADLTNFVEGPHALGQSRNVAECHVGFRAHCTHTGWGKVRTLAPPSPLPAEVCSIDHRHRW